MIPGRDEERGTVVIGFWDRNTLKMVFSLLSIDFLRLKGLRVSNCFVRDFLTEVEIWGDSKSLW